MPRIQFPNVPKLAGVPQLLRRAGSLPGVPTQVGLGGLAIGRLAQAFTSKVQWGIFSSGTGAERRLVVQPDTIMDFGYRNEYQISTFPVQQGAFASYNKVANPYEIMLKLSKGGTKSERESFIADLEQLVGSLDLFTILTPEKEYENINMSRYEVTRRGVQGAYFFADVDLYFIEIRQIAVSYSTEAAATVKAAVPAARPPANAGSVQAMIANAKETLKKLDAVKQKLRAAQAESAGGG